MGKASSSKKVARAARAGGRSAANRQRNLLFPGVIGAIVVGGVGLVALSAADRKAEDDIPPVLGDHWHAAVGVDICGEFEPATPEFENETGIHTHGDGVIHIHPFTAAATGENATLGLYLEDAGVELSNDELTIGDETWSEGDDQCDGEDAELIVAQWDDVQTNEGKPALVRRDFDDIRLREDGAGFTIAFVPEGTTDIPKPESAAQLESLGAADGGDVPAEGGGTTGGTSTDTSTGTTNPGDTSADGEAPADGSADTSETTVAEE